MDTFEPVKVDFANIRIVQTRNVLQLILEVPLEYADNIIGHLGGIPLPASPKRCALVRIND